MNGPGDPPIITGPWGPKTYDPWDLFGEVYLSLFEAGVLPPGPVPDALAAVQACRDLLTAVGVQPTESTDPLAETRRAVAAVQAVTAGAR